MRKIATVCLFLGFCLPAHADPMLYDNFSGPVANASGQFPTVGGYPWSCSGTGALQCVRGGGQLTASGGSTNLYYLIRTAATPLEISYTFTDAVEAPNYLIAITRNGTLNSMWHAGGNNSGSSFRFDQLYWCDSAAGCSTAITAAEAAYQRRGGACAATVANRSYTGRLRIIGNSALATLEDTATGTVLCSSIASDPKLRDVIGSGFYLQSSGSPNIVFTSVRADATTAAALTELLPASAPTNALTLATIIDASIGAGSGAAFGPLFALPTPQLNSALAQLSGEVAALSAGAAMSASDDFLRLLLDPSLNARGRPVSPAGKAPSGNFGMWLSGFGGKGTLGADISTGAQKESRTHKGLAAGFEYRPGARFVIGAAVGRSRARWSLLASDSEGEADVTQGGVYMSMRGSRGYANFAANYAFQQATVSRSVTFSGANLYEGKFNSSGMGARLEFGQRIARLATPYALWAFVAADVQKFSAPGYSETAASGTPNFALYISGRDENRLSSDFGLRVDSFDAIVTSFDFYASIFWRHLYTSRVQTATAEFASIPGFHFHVDGAPLAADMLSMAMGGKTMISDSLSAGFNLSGSLASQQAEFTMSAFIRQRL